MDKANNKGIMGLSLKSKNGQDFSVGICNYMDDTFLISSSCKDQCIVTNKLTEDFANSETSTESIYFTH